MLKKLENIQSDKLYNHTEEVVIEKMKSILMEENFENICTCRQCLLDIASYALNHLPAKYTTTSKGDVMTRLDEFEEQSQVDFDLIVIQAIKIVSKNPNHQ